MNPSHPQRARRNIEPAPTQQVTQTTAPSSIIASKSSTRNIEPFVNASSNCLRLSNLLPPIQRECLAPACCPPSALRHPKFSATTRQRAAAPPRLAPCNSQFQTPNSQLPARKPGLDRVLPASLTASSSQLISTRSHFRTDSIDYLLTVFVFKLLHFCLRPFQSTTFNRQHASCKSSSPSTPATFRNPIALPI